MTKRRERFSSAAHFVQCRSLQIGGIDVLAVEPEHFVKRHNRVGIPGQRMED